MALCLVRRDLFILGFDALEADLALLGSGLFSGGDDDDDEDREDGEIPDDDAEVAASPVKKATPAEPKPVDPLPVTSTSAEMPPPAESVPTNDVETGTTREQSPVEQMKPDTDVEMQDRPAEDEAEVKPTEPESVPEPQPESQAESMPEPESMPQPESIPEPEPEQREQIAPEDIVPEAVPTTDAKPDSENENTHTDEVTAMDDAMDTDPVEAPVLNEAAPQAEQQDQHVIDEPPAPPADTDQPTIVTEVETSTKAPEVTQDSAEQPLNDTRPAEVVETAKILEVAETAEGATVVKTATVVEATEPDAQAQQEITETASAPIQEPPAQSFGAGEDLLGSLEKSLGS